MPLSAPAITDEASPFALRSTRINLRTAVRQGAAWPPRVTQQLRGTAAGSLARWQVAALPSRHGCRAPRVPLLPTATRFAVPSASWCPRCPDAHRALVALSASPSASTCPASARPGVRRPARVQRPRVRCPRVWCPMFGVQCAVSGYPGVRCERPASVSTFSTPASSWSAWMRQAATSRDRLGRVTT
jgi:hypothetical protein